MISSAHPRRVVIEVPRLALRGSLNSREPWQARKNRVEREHAAVFGAMQRFQLYGGGFARLPDLPCAVRIVRISPGHAPPDDDNLAGYAKGVRDAVAKYMGTNDRPGGPVSWSVASERGPWGVRIEIEGRG